MTSKPQDVANALSTIYVVPSYPVQEGEPYWYGVHEDDDGAMGLTKHKGLNPDAVVYYLDNEGYQRYWDTGKRVDGTITACRGRR